MEPISLAGRLENVKGLKIRSSPRLVRTSAAVVATAAVGGLATDVTSRWYNDLDEARRPRWALAEILLLEVSTLDLTRRAAKADRPAAAMLVPYAGWVAFATALNAAIARRNPKGLA